ncbi:MAG: oxygen-dependent coproporphyrinogen oxidase [Bacteroidota bacterium]
MLDDHRRAERLRQETRTDRSLGERMQAFVEALQTRICRAFERLDGAATFTSDRWERPGGGGGLTRIISGGEVWEKGGVSTSAVHGDLPARMVEALGVSAGRFFATGLSLVMHPQNPYVPAVHANFRYFALGDDPLDPADQWFGGGADLTPVYPDRADAEHFHGVWKQVCDAHDVADYRAFKRQCDAYFYLPHREETRGVGGIFFDYLRDDPEGTFLFVRQAGRAFLSSYVPVAERRKDTPWGGRERDFQVHRRGRYAEFNLAFDRGTRFGLETGGRTESVLMSLPPVVRWDYDQRPEQGTPEAEALAFFRPHDWLGVEAGEGSEEI